MKYKENWKVLWQRTQEKHLKSLLSKTVQVLGCKKKKKKLKLLIPNLQSFIQQKVEENSVTVYQNERTCAQELKEEARGHVI